MIPKDPIIPELEDKEIECLTDLTFGEMLQPGYT
jgi:hypothetical protein